MQVNKVIHLVNDSDTPLSPGDMSIFDDDRFVSQVNMNPMLPGDDELVVYGEDSTVNINRLKGAETQQEVKVEMLQDENIEGKNKTAGIRVHYIAKTVTTYTIKNCSNEKSVPKLYVDHTASPQHGGFSINTSENCVKSTANFARYEFSLSPEREIVFRVEEEAEYYKDTTALTLLIYFVKNDVPRLGDEGVMQQRVANELATYIEERKLKDAVRKIKNGTASRTEVLKLKEAFTKKWLRPIIQESEKSYAIENEVEEKRRKIAAQERNVKTIEGVQSRLRENIKGLEKVSTNQATNKVRGARS